MFAIHAMSWRVHTPDQSATIHAGGERGRGGPAGPVLVAAVSGAEAARGRGNAAGGHAAAVAGAAAQWAAHARGAPHRHLRP